MTANEIDSASDETLNKLAAELWPEMFETHELYIDADYTKLGTFLTEKGDGITGEAIPLANSIDAQSPLLTELVGTGWEIRVETLFYDCETFWRCSIRKRDKPVEAIAETEPLARLRAILKAKQIQNEMEKGKSDDQNK